MEQGKLLPILCSRSVTNHRKQYMSKEVEIPKFAILIATRNRPKKIRLLLESISKLTNQPLQIVIVSSGDSIEEEVAHFRGNLNIKYLHLSQKGQIRQKIAGLKQIDESAEWILLLDDDVILNSDAIQLALDSIENHPMSPNIVGVGFSENGIQPRERRYTFEALSRAFYLTGDKGEVLKNGQNLSYMGGDECISTSWLNGISLWRRDVVMRYDIAFKNAKYSACEDLIFSYAAKNYGVLIYCPFAKYSFQNDSKQSFVPYDIFRSISYWRLFFVLSNEELSPLSLCWSQVVRTFSPSNYRGKNCIQNINEMVARVLIILDILILIILKIPGVKILEMRLTDNSEN